MLKKLLTYFSLTSIFLLNTPRTSIAGNDKAICSFYSEYKPCQVILSNKHIEANLPTDYLYVDKENFLDLNVYEDLSKSSNLIVGTVSTLVLGPVGLVGFLVKKKTGTKLIKVVETATKIGAFTSFKAFKMDWDIFTSALLLRFF